jgi:hypothetical protein
MAGLGGLVKAVTVDRHTANRSEIELLEERSRGYRRELDEVRDRLNECRQREIQQSVELATMRGEIDILKRKAFGE